MTDAVRYDPVRRTFDIDIGDGDILGLSAKDFSSALAVLRIIDSLSSHEWFDTYHLRQLLNLTKEHSKWSVWRES